MGWQTKIENKIKELENRISKLENNSPQESYKRSVVLKGLPSTREGVTTTKSLDGKSLVDTQLNKKEKKKDVKNILNLEEKYPQAGECGLRSFCFLLGILEKSELNWQPEILSYEGPFGVGYLVANFKL